jgi:hypothetical protein
VTATEELKRLAPLIAWPAPIFVFAWFARAPEDRSWTAAGQAGRYHFWGGDVLQIPEVAGTKLPKKFPDVRIANGHGAKTLAIRERAILALLTEKNLSKAATKSGVNEKTLRRWLLEEEFPVAVCDRSTGCVPSWNGTCSGPH